MSNTYKKYRILIPVLAFGKAGGMRVLTQLGNTWAKMGYDVEFLSFFETDNPYYPVNFKVRWVLNNGEETEHNSVNFNPINSTYRRLKAIYKYLKKYSGEYDIVLANYNRTAWAVWLGSKANNYYYIQAYEAEFYPLCKIKELTKRLLAWLTYFLPLKRVVNAEIYLRYKNIHSIEFVPPGLDLIDYYPKVLIPDNKKVLTVGCIGRVEEWKGAHDVGEAVRILHKKGYADCIKLKVAFNPVRYENHELEQPHGDKKLSDFYRSLDVLVAPGHIQLGAIHYPVIEAMACNVPVITTGYYPADGSNSFIVPVKRPDIIAETIEKIYLDYSIAYERAVSAHSLMAFFSWENVSIKFLRIFEKYR